LKKKCLEHEVLLDETKASQNELSKKKSFLQETKIQHKETELAYQSLLSMCKEKKEFEGKLVDESRAKENAKQIVDNEKSLKLLKEELLSLQNDIHEKKEKNNRRRFEIYADR